MSISLALEAYTSQKSRWPTSGRHILAQFDAESIVVYQAYNTEIGHFAATHGYFGGEFSFQRMSWIKPGFLWMMYRSGWGRKPNQEMTLAIRLKRTAFDTIISQAIHSNYVDTVYANESVWKQALAESNVRLQWDPDHHPSGPNLERRAIQLGLKGDVLKHYSNNWIISIENISDFVQEQYQHVRSGHYDQLITPSEQIYPVMDKETALRLGVAS